jgi:hypothetical protein
MSIQVQLAVAHRNLLVLTHFLASRRAGRL